MAGAEVCHIFFKLQAGKVKLAQNDLSASLFGNMTKPAANKTGHDRKVIAEKRIAEAKASLAKARADAKAWREAKLAEYRKNKTK